MKKREPINDGDPVHVCVPVQREAWRKGKLTTVKSYTNRWAGAYWAECRVVALHGSNAIIEGFWTQGRPSPAPHRTYIPVANLRKMKEAKTP